MSELKKLQVTPETLVQTADEWNQLMKQVQKIYETIRMLAGQTECCFWGNSAEVFVKEIERRTREGIEKAESMKKFSDRLIQIAETYEYAEGENARVFGRN